MGHRVAALAFKKGLRRPESDTPAALGVVLDERVARVERHPPAPDRALLHLLDQRVGGGSTI